MRRCCSQARNPPLREPTRSLRSEREEKGWARFGRDDSVGSACGEGLIEVRLQSEILRCAQDDSVVALDDQQIKIEVGLREKRRQDADATKSRSKLNGRNLFCGLFCGGDFIDDGLGGGGGG